VLTGDVPPTVEDEAEMSIAWTLSSREPMLMTGGWVVGEEPGMLALALALLLPRIWSARRPLTR